MKSYLGRAEIYGGSIATYGGSFAELEDLYEEIELVAPASEMYPPDYDFSIVFDTVANRKARHKMEKGHNPDLIVEYQKEQL